MKPNKGYLCVNKIYLSAIRFFAELCSVATQKSSLWPTTFSGINLKRFTRTDKEIFYNILVRPIGWPHDCGIWLRLQDYWGDYLPCEGYMKIPNIINFEEDNKFYYFTFNEENKIPEISSFPEQDTDSEINNDLSQKRLFEFKLLLLNL